MESKISPSIMCADLMNLERDINTLEKLGVKYLHLDFMDGKFVPNITLSTDTIRAIKNVTKSSKRDIHIMAFEPETYFDKFELEDGDLVAVHYEAVPNLHEVLKDIRNRGALAGIALNPDTPVAVLKDFIGEFDFLLVMTVFAGFAGQPLAPGSYEKIKAAKQFLIDNGMENTPIQVDGNVSFDRCKTMREMGADIFVTGSSSVFNKDMTLEETVPMVCELVK